MMFGQKNIHVTMTLKFLTLKHSRKKIRKNFRKIFFTHNSWVFYILAKKIGHFHYELPAQNPFLRIFLPEVTIFVIVKFPHGAQSSIGAERRLFYGFSKKKISSFFALFSFFRLSMSDSNLSPFSSILISYGLKWLTHKKNFLSKNLIFCHVVVCLQPEKS